MKNIFNSLILGTGIGTFIYAPFTNWLIEYYGWRGATLILGGTLLNFCVFGSLMIDPEWLIEENKLEKRSQSIQTFSNSSVMCLDEIKKLLEKGEVAKDEVLDTFELLINTEANQQIDSDITTVKKYQSELLLPTFIHSEHEGFRSNSRRSLHPEKLKSPTSTTQQSELLSPLLVKEKQYPTKKKCALASLETLNSSEKVSYAANNFSLSSLNFEFEDDKQSIDNLQLYDDEEIQKRSGMHGSRYSLNETIIAKFSSDFKHNQLESLTAHRGNSLNIIFNNDKPVYIGGIKDHFKENSTLKQPKRKQHRKQSETVGNLKKNSSIRYSNYLKNMRVHRNSVHYRGALLSTHR